MLLNPVPFSRGHVLTAHPESSVRSWLLSEVSSMSNAGTFPKSEASIQVLSNHTPISLRVTAQSIKSGFYKRMYALQGLKSTFYTGSTWTSDYTSAVWEFTDGLLPKIVAAING